MTAPGSIHDTFDRISGKTTKAAGNVYVFSAAFLFIVVWTVGGLFVGFSDRYQLFINTGTTIVSFLMVFLIQNGINRNDRVLHLKLNELIVALDGARDRLAGVEKEPMSVVETLEAREDIQSK